LRDPAVVPEAMSDPDKNVFFKKVALKVNDIAKEILDAAANSDVAVD
jgi:hypothetical protein